MLRSNPNIRTRKPFSTRSRAVNSFRCQCLRSCLLAASERLSHRALRALSPHSSHKLQVELRSARQASKSPSSETEMRPRLASQQRQIRRGLVTSLSWSKLKRRCRRGVINPARSPTCPLSLSKQLFPKNLLLKLCSLRSHAGPSLHPRSYRSPRLS